MGLLYRYGTYHKQVLFSGRTIKDGEAAVVWNRFGEHEEIIGPRRVWLFASTIRFLDRFKAEANQFLKIEHCDGRVQHIRGGTHLFANPVLYDRVSVHDAIRLTSSNECIIVYKNASSTHHHQQHSMETVVKEKDEILPKNECAVVVNDEMTKRIVRGPTLYFPEPDESIHEFKWVSSSTNPDGFQVLPTADCTFSPDDIDISTSDGFTFHASLTFDYHVEDIHKVSAVNDPIEKMSQGLQADSHALGNSYTSQSLRDATEQKKIMFQLSQVDAYPQLVAAAQSCGIKIDSMKLTKTRICDALQGQIDGEQRLEESLRNELKKKTEGLKVKEVELKANQKSIETELNLEQMRVERQSELDEKTHQIKLDALQNRTELAQKEAEAEQMLETIRDKAKLNFLKELKGMGVDINDYVTDKKKVDFSQKALNRVEEMVTDIHSKTKEFTNKFED